MRSKPRNRRVEGRVASFELWPNHYGWESRNPPGDLIAVQDRAARGINAPAPAKFPQIVSVPITGRRRIRVRDEKNVMPLLFQSILNSPLRELPRDFSCSKLAGLVLQDDQAGGNDVVPSLARPFDPTVNARIGIGIAAR